MRKKLVMILSTMGAIASIITFFMNIPDLEFRYIHLGYLILFVLLIIVSVHDHVIMKRKLKRTEEYGGKLIEEISERESVYSSADTLVKAFVPNPKRGMMLGIFLACLAFLEKFKIRFPSAFSEAESIVSKAIETAEKSERDKKVDDQLMQSYITMKTLLEGLMLFESERNQSN